MINENLLYSSRMTYNREKYRVEIETQVLSVLQHEIRKKELKFIQKPVDFILNIKVSPHTQTHDRPSHKHVRARPIGILRILWGLW